MKKKMTVLFKSKAKLVVPESISRAARLKTGDQLEFKVSGRKITILPQAKRADDDATLTLAEAKKVRRGMKQIREGRFKLWSDVKHELGR